MVASVSWRTTRRKLSPPSASAFAPSSVLLSASPLLPYPHSLPLTSLLYFLVPLARFSSSSSESGTYLPPRKHLDCLLFFSAYDSASLRLNAYADWQWYTGSRNRGCGRRMFRTCNIVAEMRLAAMIFCSRSILVEVLGNLDDVQVLTMVPTSSNLAKAGKLKKSGLVLIARPEFNDEFTSNQQHVL